MRYLVQLVMFCLFLFFVFQMGNTNIFTMIDIPSLLFILILGHILLIANFKARDIFRAYIIPFKKDVSIDVLNTSKMVMRSLEKYMIYSGIIGFFIGLVMMLSTLDDLATIGPLLAVSLLTALYSMIYSAIIINPILISIKKEFNSFSKIKEG